MTHDADRIEELQAASTRIVLVNQQSPQKDITIERQRASFSPDELSCLLHGGIEKLRKKMRLADEISKTDWGNKSRRHFLSREEEYIAGLKGAVGIWGKVQEEGLSLEEDGLLMRSLLDLPGGFELHIGMFIPSLLSQGSREQQAKWLPKCLSLEVIGTYAQTELGHGTFVRGLETTSTYDLVSGSFILHTPTLTATKWWPGGMAKTATHAIVMARLIVSGKDHGPHAFIVQLRDIESHLPMPGITVGDIGPKFGYGGVDNGFMSMNKVSVPVNQMLSRFARIDEATGTYHPPPASNSKASYATMLFVRADIVSNSGGVLSKAVTIAARYALVRRQTASLPGQPETQVMDYENVSHTLIPLVASSYALIFMGKSMMDMYRKFEAARDHNDFSTLPDLHALSSGAKALCTWITADGIEKCRLTCGGHGFSKLSGLPTLLQNYVQNCTWEGDNNVLCLQTARFLFKTLAAVKQGKSSDISKSSSSYLADITAELSPRNKCSASDDADSWSNRKVISSTLRHLASRLTWSALEPIMSSNGGKLVLEGPVWDANTVASIQAAKGHTLLVVYECNVQSIDAYASSKCTPQIINVLNKLAVLFALTQIESSGHLVPLMAAGYLNPTQVKSMKEMIRRLLKELRPDACALVDSFGITDYELNSALGRFDGDYPKALLDMAQGSPLNLTQEGPGWETVLKPAMIRAKARSKM